MTDPIAVAIIAAVSAIVGGVITAIAHPWGQDYVNRQQHERQEASRKAQAAENDRRDEARDLRAVRDELVAADMIQAMVYGRGPDWDACRHAAARAVGLAVAAGDDELATHVAAYRDAHEGLARHWTSEETGDWRVDLREALSKSMRRIATLLNE